MFISDDAANSIYGKLSGSKWKLLDNSNTWLNSINYYDTYGRVKQVYEKNNLNGAQITSFYYNFDNTIKTMEITHMSNITGGQLVNFRLTYTYAYDHANRLLSTKLSVNNSTDVTLLQNVYNELGQIIETNIHSDDQLNYWQSLDYQYDIHGKLININKSSLSNDYSILGLDQMNTYEVLQTLELQYLTIELSSYETKLGEKGVNIDVTDTKSATIYNTQTGQTRNQNINETKRTVITNMLQSDLATFNLLYPRSGESYSFDFTTQIFNQEMDAAIIQRNVGLEVEQELSNQGITDQPFIDEMSLISSKYIESTIGVAYFNDDEGDLFGMDIKYHQGIPELGIGPQYNGNISGIKWKTSNDTKTHVYGYEYNDLNFLTDANYACISTNGGLIDQNKYSIKDVNYDANGNILALKRYGLGQTNPSGPSEFRLTDNLIYNYNGNQLTKVTDNAIANIPGIHDFKDGANQALEYTYDYNGNVISDANKNISQIKYNLFNFVQEVIFQNGHKLIYTYDAKGNRLSKVYIFGNGYTKKDYSSVFTYNNQVLESVNIAGGRLLVNGNIISYEHYITDHLGNVRVNFTDTDGDGSGDIVENHHYYPFGGTMDGLHYSNGTTNPYRFQGKEYQGEEGFEMHDFGLRMYDAQLGRWHSADPANQFVSPYLAMGNNPVGMVDPNGAESGWSYYNSSAHVHDMNMWLQYREREQQFPNRLAVYDGELKLFDIGEASSGGFSGQSILNTIAGIDGATITFSSSNQLSNFSFSNNNGTGTLSSAFTIGFAESNYNLFAYTNDNNELLGYRDASGYHATGASFGDGGISLTPIKTWGESSTDLLSQAREMWGFMNSMNGSGGGCNTQSLLPSSDVYWMLTGASWLWGAVSSLNAPAFRIDAPSIAAGKLIGKINIGLNTAATIAEGYDLFSNWDQAGRGDVVKFGVDATITSVTVFLYFTGVGTPAAIILTGVQFANTIGVFDSVYESFNKPIHGGSGSW